MLRAIRESDETALLRMQRVAFSIPDDETTRQWWELAGRENLRIFDDGDASTIGTLLDVPMGLWAHGRRVSLHGVAGVAVVPEARGRGIARRMMTAYLEELAAKGIATSALYASTRSLYRSVQYGIAGQHFSSTLPADALRAAGRSDGAWRPIRDEDWPSIQARRPELVRHDTGTIARGPYIWARIRATHGKVNDGWMLDGPDGPRAWVVVKSTNPASGWAELIVIDRAASDHDSLLQLIGFLSSFGSMARTVRMTGGPRDPLLDLLPEFRAEQTMREPYLLRIVDLKNALEQRGWPVGFRGELSLQVSDPLLPANDGSWSITIEDGKAVVQRGRSATLRIDVLGLAGLFTGYSTPWALRTRGLLDGDDLDILAAAFAGPAPGTPDFF